MRRTLTATFAVAVLFASVPAQAQNGRSKEPRRPRLAAAADTNSANAYYSHGVGRLESSPAEAADAFYWATRIEPGWADAWYARRIALLMSRPERLASYMEGNRRTVESRDMQAIDSLHYRALMLNPFLRTKFDKQVVEFYLRYSAERSVRRRNPTARIDPAELKYWIDSYMVSAGPSTRGWVAYAEGRFPDALEEYGKALKRSRNRAGIHADRARIFVLVGRPDSAVVEMQNAVERLRQRDRDDLVFLYESKALYEHSVGIIREQQGKRDEAREAYGRALQEDLSYYPAHVALANLALASGDTATALAEMDLAVQIREDDPTVRYAYAQVLAVVGRPDEALPHARRAVEAAPHYAAPYALLGGLLEARGEREPALEQYRAFLARAHRNHSLLARVRERVAALGGGAQP